MPSLIDLMLAGRKIQQHNPWPRAVVDVSVWKFAASELAKGRWNLLGLGGERAGGQGEIVVGAGGKLAVFTLVAPDRFFPAVGMPPPPALRLERPINALFGLSGEGFPDPRPWLDHNNWRLRFPL